MNTDQSGLSTFVHNSYGIIYIIMSWKLFRVIHCAGSKKSHKFLTDCQKYKPKIILKEKY